MQSMANLLPVVIFLPLVGAATVLMFGEHGRRVIRGLALVSTLLTFFLAAYLAWGYTPGTEPYAVSSANWLGLSAGIDVQLSLGLDGLSLWLFALSALLSVTAVLVSWEAIVDRPMGFYALLLMLETGMLGVFAARDIILFYIFFEFTLIPLFFLIGIWGSEDRRYAAGKFFLCTLAGSLLTFLGLLSLVLWNANHTGAITFSIPAVTAGLTEHPLPLEYQMVVFVALFAGFAIKVPLFPLHTWLPLAHVQAPTAGSVVLAGILLKIGTYGFLRFNIPMLPDATARFAPYMMWLAAIGIIYGALVALVQTDIKRLIAYSSVSHLGFCMLGLFALNRPGVQGGVLQMINHGLSTGGLFAVVGMIYERYHTREISKLGGLTRRTPALAFFMLLFTFSSIGLPALNGFAGEFLILLGAFQRAAGMETSTDTLANAWSGQFMTIAVVSVLGVVLGAWYMLYLVQRVFFGPLKEPADVLHHAAEAAAAEAAAKAAGVGSQASGSGHGHGHDDHSHGAHGHGGHAPAAAAHATHEPAHHDDHGHAPADSHGHGHADHGHGHGDAAHGHDHAPALPPLPPGPRDLSFRELFALAPLVFLMVWIGLKPQFFLDRLAPDADEVTAAARIKFDDYYYGSPGTPAVAAHVPDTAGADLSDSGVTAQSQATSAEEMAGAD